MRNIRTLLVAMVLGGLCTGVMAQQSYLSGQWATNGHAYSLGAQGLAPDRAVAFYDVGRTKPRAWFNYGPVLGTDLTNGQAVGGFGVWGFYEFEKRTGLGVTGTVGYVWPNKERGTTVLGLGLGKRF